MCERCLQRGTGESFSPISVGGFNMEKRFRMEEDGTEALVENMVTH